MKITKPPRTGGLISRGTVAEQLLYEVGDPRCYVLPDVVCDFTRVSLKEVADGVIVSGARGRPPTDSYKVCATFVDGFKATAVCCVGGPQSAQKARRVADAVLKRCRRLFEAQGLKRDFARSHVQVVGSEDTYGPHARSASPREAVLWLAVHHQERKALEVFAKEVASAGTGMAPGLTAIVGGRPKPNPLLRLHSFLVPKETVVPSIKVGGREQLCRVELSGSVQAGAYELPDQPLSNLANELVRGNKR